MADCPVDMEGLGPRPSFAAKSRLSCRGGWYARSAPGRGRARRLAVSTIAALSLVISAVDCAAGPTIYKCLDNHLGLVYTDVPCKDGEKLDIRGGDADPAAVARLERIRDQLDQSAAQRIIDERRAAAQLAYAQQLRREAEDRSAPQDAAAYEPYFDYGYIAYPPFDRRHLPRERPHQHERARGFAPSPPYIVPRP